MYSYSNITANVPVTMASLPKNLLVATATAILDTAENTAPPLFMAHRAIPIIAFHDPRGLMTSLAGATTPLSQNCGSCVNLCRANQNQNQNQNSHASSQQQCAIWSNTKDWQQ